MESGKLNKSTVKDKSFNFAIKVVHIYKYLMETKNEFVLSKQILKSGTSIGLNFYMLQNILIKSKKIQLLRIVLK